MGKKTFTKDGRTVEFDTDGDKPRVKFPFLDNDSLLSSNNHAESIMDVLRENGYEETD